MRIEKVEQGSGYYWAFVERDRGVVFSCHAGDLERTLLKDPYLSGPKGEVVLEVLTGNAGHNAPNSE